MGNVMVGLFFLSVLASGLHRYRVMGLGVACVNPLRFVICLVSYVPM